MPIIDYNDLMRVSHAMKEVGGSFVKQLGELLQRADSVNLAKINECFPEEIKKYRSIAAKLQVNRE